MLERCLHNAEELCKPGFLIDPFLSSKQAQKLLHMICYPENESKLKEEMDQKTIISRILENLEQWSLRISWLDLQLMFKQTNTSDRSNWLDMVARAAIDVFQILEDDSKEEKIKQSIWLVSPLISKLPSVQGHILRVAGQVLEQAKFFNLKYKESYNNNNNNNSNNNSNSSNSNSNGKTNRKSLNHQPFLGLVLTCLKSQDEYKESLLQSLHTQLTHFLASQKDVSKF